MKEGDHQDLTPRLDERLCFAPHGVEIDRLDERAVGADPFGHFAAIAPLDQGSKISPQAVGVRAISSAQLQHIAKSRGRDQTAVRTLTLDDGVGRDRCPVDDKVERIDRCVEPRGPLEQRGGEIACPCRHLGDPHRPVRRIDQVRMRPTDIDAEDFQYAARACAKI